VDTRSGATVPGCLHVHRTVGGQHDTVVTLGRLAADQLVQDVVTHALGVAGASRQLIAAHTSIDTVTTLKVTTCSRKAV